MAIDKLLLANRNTKPEGGKTAVPTGINNAQTTYSQKPCPTVKGYVPVARNPNPKPHKTPKSIHPQKQHNTAIKFPLFLGSRP